MNNRLLDDSWRITQTGRKKWNIEFFYVCSDNMYVKFALDAANRIPSREELEREWTNFSKAIEHDFGIKAYPCTSDEYFDNAYDEEDDKEDEPIRRYNSAYDMYEDEFNDYKIQ